MKNRLAIVLIFLAGLLAAHPAAAAGPNTGAPARVVPLEGAIGPATADFVAGALETARDQGAGLVVLTLDTPGGLSSSMRDIIRAILDAPIPVAGFVAPSGARAASAGTYILYACHVAAMAPGTNLGAATPVRIGGGMPLPGREEKPGDEAGDAPPDAASGDPMEKKMVNDAAAYIRSLAEMRGRNAEWAERSVREGASLSVNAAREANVIDVIAADVDDLLQRIDGREVKVAGRTVTLATAGAAHETIEPGWRIRLLRIVTDPNIAFLLVLVGIYGLIFEFANPGSVGPGLVGVICLLLGGHALNLLPLNHAGLALLLLAVALMTAEAFVPSFGVLGIAGLAAFVLAALMLFDTDVPGLRISWAVIGGAAALSGGLLIFLLGYVWRAHRRPVVTGEAAVIGRDVEVLEWSGGRGRVRLGGERWQAAGAEGLSPGDRVVVRGRQGLLLEIGRKDR